MMRARNPLSGVISRTLLFALFQPKCPLCGVGEPFDASTDMFCAKCLAEMNFISGKPCPVCGGDINGIFDLCPDCLSEPERPWTRGFTVFRYSGRAVEAVRLFKYGGRSELARPFGRLMAGAMEDSSRYAALIPVPLHWIRFLQRGYNQSELLAREISKWTGIPVSENLKRIRNTKHQAFLDREERSGNIAGAFAVRHPEELRGKRVLLIDDVMTTGATLAECARVLKEAGAEPDSSVIARRQKRG